MPNRLFKFLAIAAIPGLIVLAVLLIQMFYVQNAVVGKWSTATGNDMVEFFSDGSVVFYDSGDKGRISGTRIEVLSGIRQAYEISLADEQLMLTSVRFGLVKGPYYRVIR